MALKLVAPGKGILATDATEGSMNERMQKVGIQPTPELRRAFRELLLTTKGVGEFISGVILNDEIIRQTLSDGTPFAEQVKRQGMIPGIKVDKKAHDLANFPGEKITEGLDGLRDRLLEYKGMGAEFTKWRAVIAIGEAIPTDTCINSNSEALARFAALSQEGGLIPILEPEVLMEGDHDIDKSGEVTTRVLKSVFQALSNHRVFMQGLILKTNLIHPGKESSQKSTDIEIAQATLRVLKNTVPDEVPGVVFLSGGDPAEEITSHLDITNEIARGSPWQIGFSFERALEGPSLEIWKAEAANVVDAQKEFYKRARLNSLARSGKYEERMESEA